MTSNYQLGQLKKGDFDPSRPETPEHFITKLSILITS